MQVTKIKLNEHIIATLEPVTVEIKERIPGEGIQSVIMFKADAIALAKTILEAYGEA